MHKGARQQAERQGRRAEQLAAWLLRLKGYRILDRRVRCPVGEIDIIAKRGRTLCFVEVKHRATLEAAQLALSSYNLRRVFAASQAVAHRYSTAGDTMRFDAIIVAPRRVPRHLINIWHE